MLLRSLGEDAVSGLGDALLARPVGDVDPALNLPDGELLRLRVCDPGVTVSKALPSGEDPTALLPGSE